MSGWDRELVRFLRWGLPRTGCCWRGFRRVRRQVGRRLRRRLAELGLDGLDEYRHRLESDVDEWRVFESCCRITISRFYREAAVFADLAERVLPQLAGRGPTLRVWSAGCASGEEPYTVKLLWELELQQRFPRTRLEIVATDLDPHLLERARARSYRASSLRELPARWREEAFVGGGDRYRLRDRFAAGVELLEHDVRRDPAPGAFDLVLCRYLAFTYFDAAGQRETAATIAGCVDGALVVGAREALPGSPSVFEPWEGARATFRVRSGSRGVW